MIFFLHSSIYSLFKKIIFLFEVQSLQERKMGKGRERERNTCWSTPQVTAMAGAGPVEGRIQELLLFCSQGPNTLATCCCFPSHLSRELGWKWYGQNLHRYPYRMLAPQEVALSAKQQPWPPKSIFFPKKSTCTH